MMRIEREKMATYKAPHITTIFDEMSREWTIRYFTPDVEGFDGTSGMEWDDPVTFKNHDDAIAHAAAVVGGRWKTAPYLL